MQFVTALDSNFFPQRNNFHKNYMSYEITLWHHDHRPGNRVQRFCFDVLTVGAFTFHFSMSHSLRVVLREVVDADLPIFFAHQRDPESTRMAAFPARDHDAFFAHWAKIRRDPANIIKTIVFEGEVAGNIGSWPAGDKRLLAYWIGREFWGRGIATAALAAFILEVKHRPLHAFVVKHNIGSIRVLQKSGFIQQDSASTKGEDGLEDLLFALPQ